MTAAAVEGAVLRRIFPTPGSPIALDAPAVRAQLTELYTTGAPEWLRINLISSVAGSAVGSDATSDTLSNAVDRTILGVIRRASDVVLVGASSFRAEGYRLPATVPLAVVTASGNLSGHRLGDSAHDADRLLVLCPAGVTDTVRATLGATLATIIEVSSPSNTVAVTDLVGTLRNHGFARIVCEGGPNLAAQLVDARLVDEICLSTAARIGGPLLPLLGSATSETQVLTLTQLLVDDTSNLYARWSLNRAPS